MTGDQSHSHRRRCKSLLPALFLLVLTGLLVAAEQPFVSSAWSVQQEADELASALLRRPRDANALLGRLQRFLDQHGDDLVRHPDGSAQEPAHLVLGRVLGQTGFDQRYRERFATDAAEALAACDTTDRAALQAIATTYPACPAATDAWQLLANRAWDRGQLGDFRAYAAHCPDAPGIKARLAVLDQTAGQRVASPIGSELEQFAVMWQTPFAQTTGRRNAHGQYLGDREPQVAMASVDSQTMAINSGRYAFLCNPLTGSRLGPVHRLGTDTLPPAWAKPACDDDHVVMLGRSGVFHTITCLDHSGHQRWRANADALGHQTACSNPVIVDRLVVVCTVGSDDTGITIRANGFSVDSGQARWSTQIAKVPGRQMRRQVSAPLIAVVDGQILVTSQHGFLALLTPAGRLERLIPSPRRDVDALREAMASFGQPEQERRPATLLTLGSNAVTCGDTTQGLLFYNHATASLTTYQGDGKDDQPLDGTDSALLLGGSLLRYMELPGHGIRWQIAAPDGRSVHWAQLYAGTTLAASDGSVFLVDNRNGRVLASSDAWPNSGVLGQQSGVIIGYGNGVLRGFGAAERLMQTLVQRIARQPDDIEAQMAIAVLLEAQQQPLKAVDHLLMAIDSGGPQACVDRALSILRPQLQLQIGSKGGDTVLNALARVGQRAATIAPELAWWRGRHAALLGDEAAARAQWRTIPADLPDMIEGDAGSQIRLGFATDIVLAAIDGRPAPLGMPAITPQRVTVDPPGWRRDLRGHGNLHHDGQTWFWYCEGLIHGIAMRDGRSTWKQQGHDSDRAMLGLYLHNPNHTQQGVPVTVIPGSCAYRAGLRNDDLITAINDQPTVSGRDVQAVVRDLQVTSAFTVTVQRGSQTLSLTGELGSWPEEPVAINESVVVTRSLTIERGRDGVFEANPDTMHNPVIRVYDRQSGALRWSRTLAIRQDGWPPVLCSDNLLLLADNNGLQAWELGDSPPQLRWDQPGQGYELRHARQIGPDHILVLDEVHERVVIRNLHDGGSDFSAPWHPSFPPMLDGLDLFVTDPDQHLQRFDLGSARQRWRLQDDGLRVVAVTDSLVYTIDREQALRSWHRRNGLPHRRYQQLQRVLDQQAAGDLLYFYAVDADGRDSWGAVALGNGTVAWQQQLPHSLELQQALEADAFGVSGIFIDNLDRHVLLHTDHQGSLRNATVLERGETVLAAGGERFAASSDHFRHLDQTSLPPSQQVHVTRMDSLDLDHWSTQAATLLLGQPSTAIRGGGTATAAVSGEYLMILIDLGQRQSLTLRCSRQGSPLIADEGLVVLRPGEKAIQPQASRDWSLLDQHRLDDGRVLLLLNGHNTLVPSPWFIHFGPQNDDQRPWWLRAFWWELVLRNPGS